MQIGATVIAQLRQLANLCGAESYCVAQWPTANLQNWPRSESAPPSPDADLNLNDGEPPSAPPKMDHSGSEASVLSNPAISRLIPGVVNAQSVCSYFCQGHICKNNCVSHLYDSEGNERGVLNGSFQVRDNILQEHTVSINSISVLPPPPRPNPQEVIPTNHINSDALKQAYATDVNSYFKKKQQ